MNVALAILAVAAGSQVQTAGKGPSELRTERFSAEIKIVRKVDYGYLAYLPAGYNAKRGERYPLMVFLHGSGERGTELSKAMVHGPLKEIGSPTFRQFPFVVIVPQCPEKEWWEPTGVNALVESCLRKYRVDRDRVYLTGLSMGGFGTWAAAAERPDLYAAIAPICGGLDPALAKPLANMPIWATHGDADTAVPISESQGIIDALRALGAKPRFDIIKGGGHDVWTPVYAGQEIYDWFLTHKRQKA